MIRSQKLLLSCLSWNACAMHMQINRRWCCLYALDKFILPPAAQCTTCNSSQLSGAWVNAVPYPVASMGNAEYDAFLQTATSLPFLALTFQHVPAGSDNLSVQEHVRTHYSRTSTVVLRNAMGTHSKSVLGKAKAACDHHSSLLVQATTTK